MRAGELLRRKAWESNFAAPVDEKSHKARASLAGEVVFLQDDETKGGALTMPGRLIDTAKASK